MYRRVANSLIGAVCLGLLVGGGCSGPSSSEPAWVEGHVYDDGTGDPISGVVVECEGTHWITPANGYYEIGSIDAGQHVLTASKANYDPHQETIDVSEGEWLDHDIYLRYGVGDVSGHVYLVGTSSPISGVTVACGGIYSTTGADGVYHLSSVPDGQQVITATKQDVEPYHQTIEVLAGETLVHDIYLTSGLDVTNLHGQVFHRTYGFLQGAHVQVAGLGDWTDASGHYQLPNVPQGAYEITCSLEPYITFVDSVYLYTADKIYDIRLKREETIDFTGVCIQDSYTASNYNAYNYGAQEFLRAGEYWTGFTARLDTYVQFEQVDASGIPEGAEHTGTFIMLHKCSGDTDVRLYFSRVTEPWDEMTLTYNNAPAVQHLHVIELGQMFQDGWFWIPCELPLELYGYCLDTTSQAGNYHDVKFDSKELSYPLGCAPFIRLVYVN